jgi:cysteine desulfurase/selenocysteine lyase
MENNLLRHWQKKMRRISYLCAIFCIKIIYNFNYDHKMNHREQFPILSAKVRGMPLVYLDNAATTQKPQCVIATINEMHTAMNANIHRGIHYMAEECTMRYENARSIIQNLLGAKHNHEIIFTAGTTSAINLAAYSFGDAFVNADDEIIVSQMEHHSNLLPWQLLCQRRHARLRLLPIHDNGELNIDMLPQLFNKKTKLLSIAWASNVLGTINDIMQITAMAHAAGIPVLLDGAQGMPHSMINVQECDCDFLAFSGHKMYAPTGIGVLYAKEKYLDAMPPWQGGGDMVQNVTFQSSTYAPLPLKFEAGTANYVGAVGLGAAVEFMQSIGIEKINMMEQELLKYAWEALNNVKGIRIYGESTRRAPLISFTLQGMHPRDIAELLDQQGIAVRTGTLCAQPLMQRYGVDYMVRMSMAFYNTAAEVDALVSGLLKAASMLGK